MSKLPTNEIKTIRKRVPIYFNDPSLTKQEYRDDVDINKIIAKFKITGELPVKKGGYYADVSRIPDYQTILDQVNQAQEMFMTYPAAIRARFNNDPGQLLDWAADPKNRPEAVKMGILADTKMPSEPAKATEQTKTAKQENLTETPQK